VTLEDPTGGICFWSDPGGEVRLYLRPDESGWTLSRSDRGGEESFLLAASDVDILLRYLFDFFGPDIRQKLGLPWLEVPNRGPMFSRALRFLRTREGGLLELFDPSFRKIAHTTSGRIVIMDLVMVSRLAKVKLEDIIGAYTDSEGRPLFPQNR